MIIGLSLLILFNILKNEVSYERRFKILNSVIMKPANNTNSTKNNGIQSSHWKAMALWLSLKSIQ